MKFLQNNPFLGYRDNLILTALVEIDQLRRLSSASMSLSRSLSSFKEPEAFLDLVNQLAYHAIGHVVPEVFAESVEEELQDIPISTDEIDEVLKRPIGSVLQMLLSQQA
ncbi:hypothetical protein SAMN04490189_0061 [Pseudomonas koreensis]|uniref:hypothetical protein n=1 Tax=Pseudomonas koreensis TaxID=198620 RepID=UPI00087A0C9F|nr:hypothetical protein [Pseudomonas koreensis]KAB0514194.1 hypothetical protein F7R05_08005 [Pseudomonas koreensis]NNA62595.1 hypothetical protein [Pseudomonas koreensis]GGK47931.1 hypothetical protein GCM10009103_48060 [Pseudomonas koreensis]SDC60889.1 hypothetical protein SAMN04490189_0061 [Pseudomonas koreensis]